MTERTKKQLERMFSVMTAQERAVHIVQAWKANREEEPLVRFTVPQTQERELSELLALAQCVNHDLGMLALGYVQISEKLKLRYAWLQSMRAWAMHSQSLAHQLLLLVPEPLTESEAVARIEASRSTEFSLSEAATFLAEVRDEDRDEREWERALKEAIAAGEIRAEKKGRSHVIRYGDLVDWEGEEVPLGPEWGYEAEVLPDDQAENVRWRREHFEQARQVLLRGPGYLSTFDPPGDELPEDASGASRIGYALVQTLKEEVPLHWRDILALEMCIDEVGKRLGGEDPADEILRSALNDAKTAVQEVVKGLTECDIEVELLEPQDADLVPLRELMERAIDHEVR